MKRKRIKMCFIFLVLICLVGCNNVKNIINDFSGNRDYEESSIINTNIDNENKSERSNEDLKEKSNISSWISDTKKDQYVVTVIGMTTCPHCVNYKPIFENAVKDFDVKYYWFYVDKLENDEFDSLTSTYNLENYEGAVPYTFITKNGNFISDTIGGMNEDNTIKYLTTFIK